METRRTEHAGTPAAGWPEGSLFRWRPDVEERRAEADAPPRQLAFPGLEPEDDLGFEVIEPF